MQHLSTTTVTIPCTHCCAVHSPLLAPVFDEPRLWTRETQRLTLHSLLPLQYQGMLDPESGRPTRVRRTSRVRTANVNSPLTREVQNHALDAIANWIHKTVNVRGLAPTCDHSLVTEVTRFRKQILSEWQALFTDALEERFCAFRALIATIQPASTDWNMIQRFLAVAARKIATTFDISRCEQALAEQVASFFEQHPSFFYDWTLRLDEVAEFRLSIKLVRKPLAHVDGFGTHNQTDFCQTFHPELHDIHGVCVEDIVVPLPWRGMGFGSILAFMEMSILCQRPSDAPDQLPPLGYLLFTHVHRPLYKLTVGRCLPGYEEWLPVASALENDTVLQNFLAESVKQPYYSLAELATHVYTEYYGDASLFYDNFHVLWTSPFAALVRECVEARASQRPRDIPCMPKALLRRQFQPGEHGHSLLVDIVYDSSGSDCIYEFRLSSKWAVHVTLDVLTDTERVVTFWPTALCYQKQQPLYEDSPLRPWLIPLIELISQFCVRVAAQWRVRGPRLDPPARPFRAVTSVALGYPLHLVNSYMITRDFEANPLHVAYIMDPVERDFVAIEDL